MTLSGNWGGVTLRGVLRENLSLLTRKMLKGWAVAVTVRQEHFPHKIRDGGSTENTQALKVSRTLREWHWRLETWGKPELEPCLPWRQGTRQCYFRFLVENESTRGPETMLNYYINPHSRHLTWRTVGAGELTELQSTYRSHGGSKFSHSECLINTCNSSSRSSGTSGLCGHRHIIQNNKSKFWKKSGQVVGHILKEEMSRIWRWNKSVTKEKEERKLRLKCPASQGPEKICQLVQGKSVKSGTTASKTCLL